MVPRTMRLFFSFPDTVLTPPVIKRQEGDHPLLLSTTFQFLWVLIYDGSAAVQKVAKNSKSIVIRASTNYSILREGKKSRRLFAAAAVV